MRRSQVRHWHVSGVMFGTKAPVALAMMLGQSPSSRARIQPIRVTAGHPLPGVRHVSLADGDYVYIRNEEETGGSSYFTRVLIPTSETTSPESKRCGPDWRASADVWIR